MEVLGSFVDNSLNVVELETWMVVVSLVEMSLSFVGSLVDVG